MLRFVTFFCSIMYFCSQSTRNSLITENEFKPENLRKVIEPYADNIDLTQVDIMQVELGKVVLVQESDLGIPFKKKNGIIVTISNVGGYQLALDRLPMKCILQRANYR